MALATIVVHQKAAAQRDILFSSFFAEKNLSSQSIICFFQDSRGYMWIGTNDGLNCFNGKTIKVFKHDYLDKNSLPDNFITSISEDQEGELWVATGWGISRINTNLFTIKNYTTDSHSESLGFKVKVYVDKENNVWAFSGSNLYRLNKTTQQFEKKKFIYKNNRPPVPTPAFYSSIFEDSEKRFWVTTDKNIYRYFPGEERCVPFTKLSKDLFFHPIKEDADGNLFCGTWQDGLFKLNLAKNILEPIESVGLYNCYVPQKFNGKNMLWYGSRLSAYNQDTRSTTTYKHDNQDPYSCKNDAVSALLVDAQNQLWIGYSTKGIQIVSPANQVFKTYSVAEKDNMFPLVISFMRTKNYAYAGGWYNYSLVRLDKNYKPLKAWKTLIPKIDKTENNISDGWPDHEGNLWLSSCFGLIKFNEATEKTELFKLDTSITKRSHFLQILPEGDSVLWLSGYFCGLSRFSLKTKTFQNWGAKERVLYWSIARDNQGMIWLANNSSALTGFDPVKKTFTNKFYPQLAENAIYSNLVFDSIGNAFWIATTNGLLKVDRKTFAGKLFTEKDNLPTNQVNTLQFDAHHRLWIATNKGLCFYDPAQNVFKNFFSNNGLPGNLLNQLFQIQSNGELFIGCKDGFSVLQTNAVTSEALSQSVIIDKVYESGNIVPVNIKNGKKIIELDYNKNNLQVEFYSNDLINSEDNQLLFRLEGYDNKWYTAQNGIVNYSELAPGKYLFHASCINHAGLKLKQDDYLTVIIHPPFWKTTWFLIVFFMGLFGLTLLAARYVFTRNFREKILILEKEQAIEKERSRISQDMHDELGSGLTKISIMSEVAITQLANSEKAKGQLETISSSSRELVDNLQDIIWILNSKNDSLENLCAYLQEYALKYFEVFDINVHIDFPETIPHIKLSEDQRRNILLVFKESFNNISKHSACTNVNLDMTMHGKIILFTIKDNGRGFDKAAIRNFANGLQNMKKRMSYIHGSFEISSVVGHGTFSKLSFTA